MQRLAIIGAGDLGRLLAHHASGQYHIAGFFDDYAPIVLGALRDVQKAYDKGQFDVLMVAIGYKHMPLRQDLFERFVDRIPIGTVIHPSCNIDPTCRIGEGSFLLPGCTLDYNVTLGPNVLLNTGCVIAHDTTIGAHSFLAPAVKIAGFVNVGKRCNLGIGTVLIDNLKLCDDVRTGGGAVVVESLTEPGLYLGVPARQKR